MSDSNGKWGRRGCSKEQDGKNPHLKHSSVHLGIFIQLHQLAVAMWNEDTRCWMGFILSFHLEPQAIINSSQVLRLPSWCETSESRVVFLCPAASADAPLSAGSPKVVVLLWRGSCGRRSAGSATLKTVLLCTQWKTVKSANQIKNGALI